LDERGEWTDAYVRRAIKQVVEAEVLPKIVVVRSTLLPGTLASIAQATRLIDGDVELYLNPEFTREGTAVGDFLNPDRIVIGTTAHRGQMIGAALLRLAYATLGRPVLVTDSTTAELIKVGSNMVLAAKVALANELARLAATLDADICSAVDGIGMDHRIGRAFLTPGPGIGGSCLPSQARAVDRLSMATGTSTPLISAVARSNGMQTKWVAETLERLVSPAASVAVLGVTFKAGTDDIRESPALAVAAELDERGWSVAIHDPVSGHAGARWLEARGVNVFVSASVYEVVRDRDAVLIATEWSDYRAIDWAVVASEMRGDLVFDGRGIVDSEAVSSAGLRLAVHGRLTR
jgi:UDPglucose 6-dehydrogenase